MRTIPLGRSGSVTVVDDQDYEYLSGWKWKLHPQGYASRTSWRDGHWITILMHRVIIDPADGLEVDHRNGDKLDNRRSNLRAVSHSVNERNKPLGPRNTSGVRGVSWDKSRGKWMAKTKHLGHHVNLGRFDTLDAARSAIDAYVASIGETP